MLLAPIMSILRVNSNIFFTVKIKVEELIENLLKNDTALQPAPEQNSGNNQHNDGQQEKTYSPSGQDDARESQSLSFSKSLISRSLIC